MEFLSELSKMKGLLELSITTNGVLTAPFVPELKKIGIHSVNLSMDTLDRGRYFAITHRDELPAVQSTLDELLKHGMDVKLNSVVMDGKNTQDILPMIALSKELPLSVRFIEEMPFNGIGSHYSQLAWNHVRILNTIRDVYPDIQKIADPAYSTSYNYQIPGHRGTVGVIAAYSRSFCGTCNRIRITPVGMLKTCLYDDGVLNIKKMMRDGKMENDIQAAVINAISHRASNGWEAENNRTGNHEFHESMATIGG